MTLPPDWNEFFALLCAHDVRFLVVGAHALAANGRPRATQDIDIWVEPKRTNAVRLCAVLVAFGFEELSEAVDDLSRPDRLLTLGNPPLRIDIMTSIDGVDFGPAWADRLEGHLGDHPVAFLGRDALIANKRASGRPKDLLDVELLLEGHE